MPGLIDKLRMIDAAPKNTLPKNDPEKPTASSCYHRSDRFPLSSFSAFRHMRTPVLSQIFGIDFPAGVKPEDLLFLDTETTGLSGGVGTIAFEVGLGYISGDHFVVEQFMLRDYPEEAVMLESVSRFTGRFPVLVTFNGRTFDAPLLESRYIMQRISSRAMPSVHADVLHASRRVWKLRLGSCTLQRLENAILGVSREDDLPGALVPQTFFRFLQNGDFAPMEKILEHNRQDVVSLAQLLFFLCRLFDQPESALEPDDLVSLAKAVQRRGDTAKAKKCFRLAAKSSHRNTAYSALAEQEKREGNAERAIKLYSAMLAHGDNPVSACIGLAKLYEHQLRDPQQALVYTRQALLLLSEPNLKGSEAVQSQRNALQYRYTRLRRKIAT